MSQGPPSLRFAGGAGSVTGSKYVLRTGNRQGLLERGLFQGLKLWGSRLACWQGWIYFVGVLIFARGMISGGLLGTPRRTLVLAAPYHKPDWHLPAILTGVGGTMCSSARWRASSFWR